jgi:hypothetical protein
MKTIYPYFFLSLAANALAQTTPMREWQQRALDFNNRGDHNNAVIVLQQGLKRYPGALALEKDLTTSFTTQTRFCRRPAIGAVVGRKTRCR